ncbi:STAS domain-containing protein [Streptomyces sp. NPDC020472]|uniref:STAS domain-containing protein n=1 Tax=Streptomyces sp. NPDC020472 TaxID=3365075 RepID=UPI00378B63B3
MKSDDRTQHEELYTSAVGGHLYSAPGGTSVYRRATRYDGTALLKASGEFDLDSTGCLRQALADARNDGATRIRLDLTTVTFGDSSFLHTLVHANTAPTRLVLVGPLPRPLRHLFDLTGTTPLFHIDT